MNIRHRGQPRRQDKSSEREQGFDRRWGRLRCDMWLVSELTGVR